LAVNLGIVAGVSIYGFTQWGWGESAFRFENEEWFGKNTKSGGADKLGHAYTGAVATALTTSLYRHWGHDEKRSVNMGAFAGLLATTMIEVGDGFSEEHGFSWEDQVFNMAGVGLEYLRQRYPELRERVQFRWEYFPSSDFRHGGNTDILTDYEGSRWMLAFPLQAWLNDEPGWLGWFDVLVGYGSRGYSGGDDRRRHPFIGIGLSLPKAKQPGPRARICANPRHGLSASALSDAGSRALRPARPFTLLIPKRCQRISCLQVFLAKAGKACAIAIDPIPL
jgi:hypothetical protein